MKKFAITWELTQTGVSDIDAKDLDDAKEKAEKLNIDFGDPEQFTQLEQWDDGWKVKSIKEVG